MCSFRFTVSDSVSWCAVAQISKYVESLAIARKGVWFSHGPDWAREVFFCQEKMVQEFQANAANANRIPDFLSPTLHMPL